MFGNVGIFVKRRHEDCDSWLMHYFAGLDQETRKVTKADTVEFRLPVKLYFQRPAHAGHKAHSCISNKLTRLFKRNLGVVSNQLAVEREMEAIKTQQHDQRKDATYVIGQAMDTTEDATCMIDQPVQGEVDIEDLPTQKLETVSHAEISRSAEDPSPRETLRSSNNVFFRESQELVIEAEVLAEAEEKNIPINQQSPTKSHEKSQEQVMSLLEQAGLMPEIRLSIDRTSGMNGSEDSENPSGSLDRTVSLGDSNKTTDSMKFIRHHWGTVGTMTKILEVTKISPRHPITVSYLMFKGPVVQNCQRIIAAFCFSSILKLKQHGFIIVHKDPETLEIRNIILGPKFD